MVFAKSADIRAIKEKGFKVNQGLNQEYSQLRGKHMFFLYASGYRWVLEVAVFKGYTELVYKRTFSCLTDALIKFDELAVICKEEEK